MKTNFDDLRKNLVKRYNTLCRKVLELEDENEREDLSDTVDDLRDLVVTFACLESEAEGFKALQDVTISSVYEEEGDDDDE